MKKNICVLLIILALAKLSSYEDVLIDFTKVDGTAIDFSHVASGYVWSDEIKKAMITDLSPENWRVRVNSSSWTKEAKENTYTLKITNSLNYPNQTLLGIRIYFPERKANSYAEIFPPFTIPSYYDNPKEPDGMGAMFLNKGIVRNVGILRKISVRFLGNNFKYTLYLRIENRQGVQKDLFIGYMDFLGWKSLAWVNPDIEEEIKARDVYKKTMPYYPDEIPYIKLVSIIIHRDDPQITGNFVTMIKDITVEYDKAFLEVGKAEYKQEEIFGIYKKELVKRAKTEMEYVDRRIYLEWLERMKMDK